MDDKSLFRKTLINWYLINRRELPWRQVSDPYMIWVSEIILQQTRVNQGLDYYKRFVSRFPDIRALAQASEEEVLKIWQGLGYYSRARNMHTAARFIVDHHNGRFPETSKALEKLKGIGKYTAAAIASIAYNEAVAVVDGNVIRFLSRYFGISEPVDQTSVIKEINRIANDLINNEEPGTFNQAMMEFGAMQCVPANPDCANCCFKNDCVAFNTAQTTILPVKSQKPQVKARYFNYLVILPATVGKPCFYLKRRSSGDIWKHLYDFPLIESSRPLTKDDLLQNHEFKELFKECDPEVEAFSGEFRHVLTHRIIHARFFKITFPKNCRPNHNEDFVCTDEPNKYPIPVLIHRFLTDHGAGLGFSL